MRSAVQICPGPLFACGLRRTRGLSSAGRALALQAGGHRFDPDRLHKKINGDASLPRPLTIEYESNPRNVAVLTMRANISTEASNRYGELLSRNIDRFFRYRTCTTPEGVVLTGAHAFGRLTGTIITHGKKLFASRILRASSMSALEVRSSYEGRMVDA